MNAICGVFDRLLGFLVVHHSPAQPKPIAPLVEVMSFHLIMKNRPSRRKMIMRLTLSCI